MTNEIERYIIFCRDCPLFEENYWQPDIDIKYGWCRGRSYYETMDDEMPYHIYTNTASFCDRRTIHATEAKELN